jgi:hypothetical protein
MGAESLIWPEAGSNGCVGRGGHGVPKVSLGPAMPYPSMPCRLATPETDLHPFQEWPAHSAGGLRPSSTPLDIPRRTPMLVQLVHCAVTRLSGCTVTQKWLISGLS